MNSEHAMQFDADMDTLVAGSAVPGQAYRLRADFVNLQHATIMMVDDESITMRVLQSFLESAGYHEFILVDNSVTAMDVLRRRRPDILLLDVLMPEVSGFDILQALRQEDEFSHLPVIILTSSSDAATKLKALDLGATDFLSKPVDPSELALRVRNTLAAKAYQDQLAFYDPLTSLPNHHLFQDRLGWSISRAARDKGKLALLHIAFNDFKRVTDAFGPKVGDEVLKQLALRITENISAADVMRRKLEKCNDKIEVFRFGSADFNLLLPSIGAVAETGVIAKRIFETMRLPLDADGTQVYLVPSIGVAAYPDDADDSGSLLKVALGASSQSIAQGGGQLQFYSTEINERTLSRMRMEADLRRAIAEDEFKLLLQPKINLESGKIVGAEALIRWHDPVRGLISPVEFIPVAEDTGLILPIGEWVLREACNTMMTWRKQGIDLKMSVNISARQFFQADLVALVRSVLDEHKFEPSRLVLEMTESILVDDVQTALVILAQLRSLGVQISIDDFGTGYSSLSYLKMFRADEVKIDRAFIRDVTTSREDQALVYAITYLGHEMGFTVCAEGVEDSEQRDYLHKIKCDEYQGFFFSKPVSHIEFSAIYHGQEAK
ncbi:putative bifunctional diguanylate cyclase/phosphodiesterase [Granulosicoccus antarcticus]|uniref:cyclic-guanylate-specific phosphodiesterase n=1 Tax=Granulosicoccus antarcticus IMCC3135 TaxID=1192854 RepID=A0A2Z2NVL2_9GAMM|nr:EAL domain-containing response regulator [Granulosicoccus antarcticus]ASJ75283.1 Cyclic di-GMP phosphodiesterase Gmr [Granulosicoccus antarcticus IMCC3135]